MEITKERKIELLELLKEKYSRGGHNGLCIACNWLCYNNIVNNYECEWLKNRIYYYKPDKTFNDSYYFKEYSIQPRINLIDKIIEDIRNDKY